MEVKTDSGVVNINKRTPYGKWLIGYMNTGAWAGWYTLEKIWESHKNLKPDGCSWQAWGVVCALAKLRAI